MSLTILLTTLPMMQFKLFNLLVIFSTFSAYLHLNLGIFRFRKDWNPLNVLEKRRESVGLQWALKGFVRQVEKTGKCNECGMKALFVNSFKCKCNVPNVSSNKHFNVSSHNVQIVIDITVKCVYCKSTSHSRDCIFFHGFQFNGKVCSICNIYNSSIVLIPCRHSFCIECTLRMDKCAICRVKKTFFCFKVL